MCSRRSSAFAFVLLGAILAVSPGSTVPVSAAPAATVPCSAKPRDGRVFFVTDREPVGGDQLYSGERGLTKTRDPIVSWGTIGTPVDAANERRCASEAAFFAAFSKNLTPSRGVLIYVHGYYTTFHVAVENALAMQKVLKFSGPLIVYSWPSKVTSRLTYMNDESNARWSEHHFRDLLATLMQRYKGVKISFATHSLGARFAEDGLDFIRRSTCPQCIGRVLFFAPDVDADTLRSALVAAKLCRGRPPEKPAHAAPVTLYVSNKDLALRQSQTLHGHQRGGQAGNEMLLCSGVDTVDVSYFKGSDKAGHTYQVDATVVGDARAAFAGAGPASAQRKLKRVTREGGVYYELRP